MKSFDDFIREQQEYSEEHELLSEMPFSRAAGRALRNRRRQRNRNRNNNNNNQPPKGRGKKDGNGGGNNGRNRGGRGIPGVGAAATVAGGAAELVGKGLKGIGGLAMNAAKELLRKQEAPTSVNSAQKLTPAEKI